jgi:hypothetical protein
VEGRDPRDARGRTRASVRRSARQRMLRYARVEKLVVERYRTGKVLLVLYVRHASERDWREQDIVPAAEGRDKIMAL